MIAECREVAAARGRNNIDVFASKGDCVKLERALSKNGLRLSSERGHNWIADWTVFKFENIQLNIIACEEVPASGQVAVIDLSDMEPVDIYAYRYGNVNRHAIFTGIKKIVT